MVEYLKKYKELLELKKTIQKEIDFLETRVLPAY